MGNENLNIPNDENGDPFGYLGGSNYIIYPPEIDIVDGHKNGACLVEYPLPNIKNLFREDWIKTDEGIKRIHTQIIDYYQILLDKGWKKKTDTDGLLNELLKLANGGEEKIIEGFVLKWGPIWKCGTHESSQCFANPSKLKPDCFLLNKVEDFVNLAKTIESILKISESLRNGSPADEGLWNTLSESMENLSIGDYENSFFVQRIIISGLINNYLSAPCGPGFSFDWVTNDTPKLTIGTGIDFSHAAWLQLAEVIVRAKGLYTCDSCGKAYIRHKKRKPQKGRNNYCDDCGKGQKASKRIWAERKRNERNQI